MKKSMKLNFKSAFNYPFNRAKRMWYILWLLLPIFGWFALGGYGIRIIKEFSKGKFKQLPEMKFGSDMKLGFFMFIKAIPFILAYVIVVELVAMLGPWVDGVFGALIDIFVIPIMFVHFFNKESVGSLFELNILGNVFGNFWDYIVAVLKDLLLAVVFLIMWIALLVGIPAGTFTQSIFIADFYRRNVK